MNLILNLFLPDKGNAHKYAYVCYKYPCERRVSLAASIELTLSADLLLVQTLCSLSLILFNSVSFIMAVINIS